MIWFGWHIVLASIAAMSLAVAAHVVIQLRKARVSVEWLTKKNSALEARNQQVEAQLKARPRR